MRKDTYMTEISDSNLNQDTYLGKDILHSKKYKKHVDLLRTIIKEDDFYDLERIDNLLNERLTKKEDK